MPTANKKKYLLTSDRNAPLANLNHTFEMKNWENSLLNARASASKADQLFKKRENNIDMGMIRGILCLLTLQRPIDLRKGKKT